VCCTACRFFFQKNKFIFLLQLCLTSGSMLLLFGETNVFAVCNGKRGYRTCGNSRRSECGGRISGYAVYRNFGDDCQEQCESFYICRVVYKRKGRHGSCRRCKLRRGAHAGDHEAGGLERGERSAHEPCIRWREGRHGRRRRR